MCSRQDTMMSPVVTQLIYCHTMGIFFYCRALMSPQYLCSFNMICLCFILRTCLFLKILSQLCYSSFFVLKFHTQHYPHSQKGSNQPFSELTWLTSDWLFFVPRKWPHTHRTNFSISETEIDLFMMSIH